jgi:hypothetical protein
MATRMPRAMKDKKLKAHGCAFLVRRCGIRIRDISKTPHGHRRTTTATRTANDLRFSPLVIRNRRRNRPPVLVFLRSSIVESLRAEIVPCAISATYSKTISARVLASIELQSSATARFNLGIPWRTRRSPILGTWQLSME